MIHEWNHLKSTIAHRTIFRGNPQRNDTSNPSAPNNRDRSGEHLEQRRANPSQPFLRKFEKTSKIALFAHFCRLILIFKTPYSLPKHPRWPYLLEKGGSSAKSLQTFGLKNMLFSQNWCKGLFWGKIADFLNFKLATFQCSYHLFHVNKVIRDAWGGYMES